MATRRGFFTAICFSNAARHPLFLLVAILLAGIGDAAENHPRPPNIVLIMPGGMGIGDLACNGNPIVQTPSLDRFARESVRFASFHASPNDSASRAALLTGRHEFRGGVTHTTLERERLRLDATTIAQVLKGAGYATGVFGTWHLGDEPPYQPDQRGFDEVFIHGGRYIGEKGSGSGGDVSGNTPSDPILLHNGTFLKALGYSTDVFFGHAIDWMDEKLDAHIPFFACVMPNAADAPLSCPPEYQRMYAGRVPAKLAAFYGMISNIDQNFGHFLEKLDEWGIARDTLVIFLSDRGGSSGVEVFNAGLRGTARTPYEGGTRVPSLWRWPAGFAGGVDLPALSTHLDIFPTLAVAAGAKIPENLHLDGRSLLPLLRDAASPWPDRTLFTHVGGWELGAAARSKFAGCSVRNDRYALVNNSELYDLRADPGETRNVVADHPSEADQLREAYDAWWNEVQSGFVNESAAAPKVSAFDERYREQARRSGPLDNPPF